MAPHPPLPSQIVDPSNTGAEKLLSPLAIADARGLADRHNFLVLARTARSVVVPGFVNVASRAGRAETGADDLDHDVAASSAQAVAVVRVSTVASPARA